MTDMTVTAVRTSILRVLDVETRGGIVGMGYLFSFRPGLRTVAMALEETILPRVIGKDATAVEGIWNDLWRATATYRGEQTRKRRGAGGAKCDAAGTGFRQGLNRSLSALSRLQIRLPGLDRNLDGRIGGLAPEFAPVENHSVEPVRVLTLAVRDRVRKHVATPGAFDDAGMSAGIARQAGVAGRIDVAGAHAVAWLEFRRCRRRPVETAAGKGCGRVGGGQYALDRLGGMEGAAGRELVIADEAELQAQIFEA